MNQGRLFDDQGNAVSFTVPASVSTPYPSLTEKDMEDFTSASLRVFALMRDEQWHSATEIITVSQQREGLRRMRELRSCNLVHEIQKRRSQEGSREFEYRLALNKS